MKIPSSIIEKYPRLEFVNTLKTLSTGGWEAALHPYLEIVEATPQSLVFHFHIEDVHCNIIGSLHGGAVATVIDTCSSVAILSYEGKAPWTNVGVSTEMHTTYLKGMRSGETARIVCQVLKIGKTLANVDTRVYNEKNDICYTNAHCKIRLDMKL
ncbi:HotDog domain-containing protein [Spinellus fusiger]|nr:HotDog domain-containing protein [Spinellus fusiger]